MYTNPSFARGIRVELELDMPGHADGYCKGYPDLCPPTNCQAPGEATGQGLTPFDVSNNGTFEFLDGMLSEFTGDMRTEAGEGGDVIGGEQQQQQPMFPEKFFHFGGDEVSVYLYIFCHMYTISP
jgi:hexosaminidase